MTQNGQPEADQDRNGGSRVLEVCLAQLESVADPEVNIARAVEAIREAAVGGAELVVIPEAMLCPFDAQPGQAAREHAREFDDAITAAADETGIAVIAGSFEEAEDGRIHNVLLARGEGIRADYRKIHLYDAFGFVESRSIAPGDELVTVDVDGVTIGLATCYDVRFPEQFRALAERGADVVALPAAWAGGAGKAEQWDLLTRARALDATVALLAVDQAPLGGEPGAGIMGVGRSAVIGADGQPIARAEDPSPQLVFAAVDLDAVDAVRAQVPVLAHARAARELVPELG